MIARLLESAILFTLSIGTLHKWESTESKALLPEISIGVTFTKFCIIDFDQILSQCWLEV